MELNEIKKYLYKNNTKAHLQFVTKEYLRYIYSINDGISTTIKTIVVPINDMGDANFYPEMEAKLLIRWIKII